MVTSSTPSPNGSASRSPFKFPEIGVANNRKRPATEGILETKKVRAKPARKALDPLTKQKLQVIFEFLKGINETLHQGRIKTLVQACEKEGLEHLLKIKELDLAGCELEELPSEVGESLGFLPKLNKLDLSVNRLTHLPKTLVVLVKNLREIRLVGNHFTQLPSVIHDIVTKRLAEKKYIELYLSGNPIQKLPRSIESAVMTPPLYTTVYVDKS